MPADATDGTELFAGGGEMGRRMRAMDWASTPLGPVATWPQSLKTAVRITLTCRQPMFVWWGPALVNLYNDAYRSVLGARHPGSLGQSAPEIWSEIWDEVGPRAESAIRRNEGTFDEGLLLLMRRYGYPEETYFTFSYSPVPDDRGVPSGLICACFEDTGRIVGERQLAVLRDLAARTADARTEDDVCRISAACLAVSPRDVPFALIYRLDAACERAVLAGQAGIRPGHAAAPEAIALTDAAAPWPVARVIGDHAPATVPALDQRFAELPSGAWPEPPREAVVLPIGPAGQAGHGGALVVGCNPYRPQDEGYRGFLDLAAGQIASALANARAHEQERRRAEALAELDRAKTAFFSNVSHEFRTPLTLMLGPLEAVLGDGEVPAKARAELEVIHRNGLRLLRLVNTLLDFSRIEAGRMTASYRPIDLAPLTAELVSNFRSACDQAGLRLATDCPPLPRPVHVDVDMWEKIVLNLVSNAFKFTFAGGIAVSLAQAPDGAGIELVVCDTGVGIAADDLPRLFERFHRVEGVRGRTHEGSGIGLALVRELARMHGGDMSVSSAPGRGSTFTVRIPYGATDPLPDAGEAKPSGRASVFVAEAMRWLPGRQGDGTDPAIPFELDPQEEVPARPGAGPRPVVLVADDNADMRDYLRALLAPHFDVRIVADGEAALATLRAERPDIVLTDAMMPRLDGFGLIRAIRADQSLADLPVIMLSARAGEDAKVVGLDAGADDYLVKPFAARELVARLRANLHAVDHRRQALARERELRVQADAMRDRFETLIEHLPDGAGLIDRDGFVLLCNPEFRRLLPQGRAAFALSRDADGDPVWFAHDETGRRLEPHRYPGARALRGEVVRGIEFVRRDTDGSERWVRVGAIPIRDGAGEVTSALVVMHDVDEEKRATERQRLLLEELNHRAKNTLAIVQSISAQTLRSAPDPEAFRTSFQNRIQALARAHDLLTHGAWQGTSLRALADLTLGPYGGAGGRVRIDGPAVSLAPGVAISLHLAFHELATNAAKYGALSVADGRIDLTWAVERGTPPALKLVWVERDGPTVRPPTRRGFGSRMIERGLAHELDCDVSLAFDSAGVRCRIALPLSPRIVAA